MAYYLGIDAGATKTHCLVGDASGRVLGFGKAGCGNYETFGVAPAAEEIRTAIDAALAEARLSLADIAAAGLGVAGADIPEDYEMLHREIFAPLFGEVPYGLHNDSMAGLRGGTRAPYGVVIACGTGCVCAGRNPDGVEARVGGINEDFGDKISGPSIGREGLRTVWRARDGIVAPTLLTKLYLERAACPDVDAFFLRVYRGELTAEAMEPLAPLVFEAAAQGDAAACDILDESGRYLGDMVVGAARKLGLEHESFEVVMAGSVFKGQSPLMIDAMQARIHRVCPRATCVMPAFEPVVGRPLYGYEFRHVDEARIYDRLAASATEVSARIGFSLAAR